MILGIDEAGRGSAIGDLVIAGLCCKEKDFQKLKNLGVKDSKLLSPNKREELYNILIENFETKVVKLSPQEIDFALGKKISLNLLELKKFVEIINYFSPKIAYIDCVDVNPRNFKKNLEKHASQTYKLVVEHKADEKFPIVSAASIVAKVERDKTIKKLARKYREYGELGSGYPSDTKTLKFIETWVRKNEALPYFARKNWKTFTKIKNRKLDDFNFL